MHQTWMLFFSLFNERECMEKGSIESSPNTIYLSCLRTWSSLEIKMAYLIDLKGFACHWRFVTRSQQLCSKSFLLPDIEISSFTLSRLLLQCFSRQASKRNNLAKERVANVSLRVVEVHVTYTKCPPLDITVNIIIPFFFLGDQNFFMATTL